MQLPPTMHLEQVNPKQQIKRNGTVGCSSVKCIIIWYTFSVNIHSSMSWIPVFNMYSSKAIYFNCACAKLILTQKALNRPGATIPGTRMRGGLWSLFSQRIRALVNTDPKGTCPFQFLPAMFIICCCCVVVFVCVPVFPCVFLENRVVCFVNKCVLSPVVWCIGLMLQL
jgi:hypothetical protein